MDKTGPSASVFEMIVEAAWFYPWDNSSRCYQKVVDKQLRDPRAQSGVFQAMHESGAPKEGNGNLNALQVKTQHKLLETEIWLTVASKPPDLKFDAVGGDSGGGGGVHPVGVIEY